jgi:hypothetical protein
MRRSRQGNGRSTIYKGGDGRWHGRVTVGLTDEGRTDRRHVGLDIQVEGCRASEGARAGSQTRLVGPSIPEPTGMAGSVYLQPLASATGASTMPVTPQPQIFCCSACTSARS